VALFLISLRRKTCEKALAGGGIIDLNMSTAMKGIACVMILTSHWGQRRFDVDMPWGISRLVWNLSANIALVWFMFFSGYGLSLKTYWREDRLLPIWLKRLMKVYLPLLFCCVICTLGYALLPSVYSLDESTKLWISKDIYYIHHLSWENFNLLWPHVFGWKDWYVLCIIIFYSLFYLSLWLERKTKYNQTSWLFVLMCFYYVWAFCYFGWQEGHFFRYCWIFFIAHVVAKWNTYSDKRWPLLMCICLSSTLLMESKILYCAVFIAAGIVAFMSIVNKYYDVYGKGILFIGSISYFFYLLHARICYTLVVYTCINSILAWIGLTIIISWLVSYIFNRLSFIK